MEEAARLLAELRAGEPERQAEAEEALVQMGLPAVPALCVALKDPSPLVRLRAAEALARVRSDLSLKPLCEALRDPDRYVRERAAEALGYLEDRESLGPLCEALEDDYAYVRLRAAGALARLGDPGALWPLYRTLNDPEWTVRCASTAAMSRSVGRVFLLLWQAARDKDLTVRQRVSELTARIGEPAVPALCQTLTHRRAWRRSLAAAILTWVPDPRAVPALCVALKDTDRGVRNHAADALARVADSRAVEALCGALSDSEVNVRRRASEALVKVADARAVLPLCEALRDKDKLVRRQAAQAMLPIARTDPTPALRTALPLLRRLSMTLDAKDQEAFRSTLQAIERATAEVKDLPLPSAVQPASPETLPRPAEAPSTTADNLPIPTPLEAEVEANSLTTKTPSHQETARG